jgi:hypothetical protein
MVTNKLQDKYDEYLSDELLACAHAAHSLDVEGAWDTLRTLSAHAPPDSDSDLEPAPTSPPISASGTNADLAQAPSFPELTDWLTTLLAGRVVVGHNIEYDIGFLNAEYDRADTEPPAMGDPMHPETRRSAQTARITVTRSLLCRGRDHPERGPHRTRRRRRHRPVAGPLPVRRR